MEEPTNQKDVINIGKILKKIIAQRRLFYKVLPIAAVLASIYIVAIPRSFNSEAKLAPELENSSPGSALSSIASSFGLDLGNMQTSDAITPILYPDLMEDNGFVTDMFNIMVRSKDGKIETTYGEYLKKHQKYSIWSFPKRWVVNTVHRLFAKKSTGGPAQFDPYNLSMNDDAIVSMIRNNVRISVDKQTAVISISARAQDPLIAKTLTDSIKDRLQQFITSYRTNKARIDYEYYRQLADEAKEEYEQVRRHYASLSDANSKVALISLELQMEEVENDMQLKFNAYTSINTQMQAAKAKVQERTPAFTVIKGASVPQRASKPKRMFFVLGMLVLAFFGTSVFIVRKDIKDFLLSDK